MSTELSRTFPASHYRWPESPDFWVRGNLILGADWLWTVDGVSGALGNETDRALFTYLRDTADVIVVGGGTARAEDYSGARRSAVTDYVPALVVVATSARNFSEDSSFIKDVLVPTDIVVQSTDDPADVARLRSVGARVHPVLGDLWADDLVAWLQLRGFRRVLLEGGPGLFEKFAETGFIDECCVTRSPVSAAAGHQVEKYRPNWLGDVQRAWVDEEGYVGEIRRCRRPLPESDTPS